MHHNPLKTSQESQAVKKPYTKPNNMLLFAVYPDYWNPKWGELPLLGHVRETHEHWAKLAAYDNKLLPYNATFGPKVVEVDAPVRPTYKKRYETHNKTSRPR